MRENEYRDGYILLLKQDEANEALKKLILSKFGNILVFSRLEGEYGNVLSMDDSGEEMLKNASVSLYCDFVVIDPNMSEEEFTILSKDINQFLNDNDIYFTGDVLYLNGTINKDMTRDDLYVLLEDEETLRWSYYMASN